MEAATICFLARMATSPPLLGQPLGVACSSGFPSSTARAESLPSLLAGIAASFSPWGWGHCSHFCREDLMPSVTSPWGGRGSVRLAAVVFLAAAAPIGCCCGMFRRSPLGRRVFVVLLCLLTGEPPVLGRCTWGQYGRSDSSWRSLPSPGRPIDDSSLPGQSLPPGTLTPIALGAIS